MQACEVLNNRPLRVKMLNEDDYEVITCNQLLVGCTTTVLGEQGEDELLLENPALLPKHLQYCSELLRLWRNCWLRQVFPNLVPFQQYKQARRHENLQAGDVCLLRFNGCVKDTYRICRMTKTKADEDGVVRTVQIQLQPRDVCKKSLPYKHKKLT